MLGKYVELAKTNALCGCYNCKVCRRPEEGPCVNGDYRRMHGYALGIDMFRTVRQLGLPIKVLQDEQEEQNWYSLVLIR